jgi:polygalacturonase
VKGGIWNYMSGNFYGTPFDMEEIAVPKFPDKFFYVENFLKNNHNGESDYSVIQRAIEACSKSGGGTVIVTQGDWVSGH